MIWKGPGEELVAGSADLWGSGKTAIWLQKCSFTMVLGTLAKLGFCRPPVRLQELKPRKTHDLERSGRKVGGAGGALLGLR